MYIHERKFFPSDHIIWDYVESYTIIIIMYGYIHYHNWNGADIKRRLYRNWKIQNRNPFSKVDSECSCEDKSIF